MPRVERLERDGVEVWFQDTGHGVPPLLLVHDWGADHSAFQAYVSRFRNRHRVVAVDLRGHGGSGAGRPGEMTASLAEDLAWLCRQLGLFRPVLVGDRFGALVALDLADRFPAVPGALVLLGAAASPMAGDGPPHGEGMPPVVATLWLPASAPDEQAAADGDATGFGGALAIWRQPYPGLSNPTAAPVLVLGADPAPSGFAQFRGRSLPPMRSGSTPDWRPPPEPAMELIDGVLLRRAGAGIRRGVTGVDG